MFMYHYNANEHALKTQSSLMISVTIPNLIIKITYNSHVDNHTSFKTEQALAHLEH